MRHNAAARFAVGLGITALVLALQTPAFADWPTYHKDAARTGLDPTAPALISSVNQQWAHTGLDRNVYAEPLVYGTMVVVASEGNTVYALDAATGNLLWSKNYGIAVPSSQFPCGVAVDNLSGTTTTWHSSDPIIYGDPLPLSADVAKHVGTGAPAGSVSFEDMSGCTFAPTETIRSA